MCEDKQRAESESNLAAVEEESPQHEPQQRLGWVEPKSSATLTRGQDT